jgi:hypothetical protein
MKTLIAIAILLMLGAPVPTQDDCYTDTCCSLGIVPVLYPDNPDYAD